MKINSFLLIGALLMCLSCQTNDEFESDNVAIEKTINGTNARGAGGGFNPVTQAEAFESMMQWTAYLTAQALYHDAAAENLFVSALLEDTDSPYKIIDMNKLLGENVGDSSFRTAFKAQFYKYVEIDCDDEGNGEGEFGPIEGSPKPSPPIEIVDPNDCLETFNAFVSALIDYHCLEFYLPLGYDASNNNLTSTAHTLTTTMQNDCYLHPVDTDTTTLIKAGNLHMYHNPLMVRPVRDYGPMMGDCMYPEYSGVDFTLFLDN